MPFALPALAGLVVMFIPGKRRWMRSLLAVLMVIAAAQVTGCGNCTDLGTRPGTYNIQITAAAVGSSEVEAAPMTVHVKI